MQPPPSNGELRDLVTRLDERVARLRTDVDGLNTSVGRWHEEWQQKREADQADRRKDRYTLIGICVALAGVVISVIGILGQLPG